MIILDKYRVRPLIEKAKIIAKGIRYNKVLSLSIKIFFIAGSRRYAIAEVLPATIIDKKKAIIIFFVCLKV